MNWDAIGAVAELLGAAGIIYSLFRFATLTRFADRARAFQEVLNSLHAHSNYVNAEGNVEIFEKGLTRFHELNRTERIRFDHFMMGYFNLVEMTIFYQRPKLLEADVISLWDEFWKGRFLRYPGVREWWRESQDAFSDPMKRWYQSQIDNDELDPGIWEPASGERGA